MLQEDEMAKQMELSAAEPTSHKDHGMMEASKKDAELLEQLADKLGNISGPMFASYEPWPDWNKIAKEALRQMKWAQQQAKKESETLIKQRRSEQSIFINVEDVLRCHDVLWSCPLTLAPDDWNP